MKKKDVNLTYSMYIQSKQTFICYLAEHLGAESLENLIKYNFLPLTFLKMFIPRSVERSGTAGLRKLVSETLENASVLSDFSSSLHFIVRSCSSQNKTISTTRTRR